MEQDCQETHQQRAQQREGQEAFPPRPATLNMRLEGREDAQAEGPGQDWMARRCTVEASHAYWEGTQNGRKQTMEREGGEADGPVARVIWVWEPGLGMDLYSFKKNKHFLSVFCVCTHGMRVYVFECACFVCLHLYWVRTGMCVYVCECACVSTSVCLHMCLKRH